MIDVEALEKEVLASFVNGEEWVENFTVNPTVSWDGEFRDITIEPGSNAFTVSGTFCNAADFYQSKEEEDMASKENEMLLDLLIEEPVGRETLRTVRHIISSPKEWDTRLLIHLLIKEVGRGLTPEMLGLASEADE